MRYRSQLLSCALVCALAILSGCDSGSSDEAHGPRLVKSVVIKAQELRGLTFTGTVQARVQASLAFRLVGRVISRPVEVGDVVEQGQILAEIDAVALELAVQKALAELREADARRTNAGITEKRVQSLAARNLASKADLELAVQGLQSAQSSVVRARANLVKAREQLSYAKLKAEFTGVVTAVGIEPGQTVTPGQSILTLARLGARDVVVDASASQLDALRIGTQFDVRLQLAENVRASGKLREIGPEADSDTRMHRIKIAIDDASETFRLGSVVTATVADDQSRVAARIPSSAILRDGKGDRVWVVDPKTHTLSRRSVRLEASRPGERFVRVIGGLEDGEVVAAAGVDELKDGQTVSLEGKSH